MPSENNQQKFIDLTKKLIKIKIEMLEYFADEPLI